MRVGVGGGRRPPPASPRALRAGSAPGATRSPTSPPAPLGVAARPGPREAGGAPGRSRGPRAGRRGGRRRRPEPSRAGVPSAPPRRSGGCCRGWMRGGEGWRTECGGEGRARPEPAGPREVEGTAQPGLLPGRLSVLLITKYRTEQGKAALCGTHTTSEAENDHINSCGCSVEVFLKR